MATHAGAAGRELLQQAALADAGLADEQEHASRRPGVIERLQLALAADQARRSHQAGRNHGAARRQGCGAALDRRQQLDRLGRRPGAQLVLQALLEALERGDRRRPVAAQIVQAHQAALACAPPAGRSRSGAARRPGRARPRRVFSHAAAAAASAAVALLAPFLGARRAATRRAREGRRSRGRRAVRPGRRARPGGSARASSSGRGSRPAPGSSAHRS